MTSFARPAETVTDEYDRPVPGAKVYVYLGDGTEAPLTSDGTTPLAQPVTTDEFGVFSYYVAAAGVYREDFWFSGKRRYRQTTPIGLGGSTAITVTGAAGNDVSSRVLLAAIDAPGALQNATLTESGREGTFVFDSSNLTAHVAADTAQGIYVAPASDTTGASGAWVRKFTGPLDPRWFGLSAGDSSANGATNSAAFAALLTAAAATGNLHIRFKGTYWFADNGSGAGADIYGGNLIIEGSTGCGGATVTDCLKAPSGVTLFRIQDSNTSGFNTKGTTGKTSAKGTLLRNLAFVGSFTGTEAEAHGVQVRAKCMIENCTFQNFEGDGIYVSATSAVGTGATPPYGNANRLRIKDCKATSCRNGLFLDGLDVNACTIDNFSTTTCRQWGIWDSSFLGNHYYGGLHELNGVTSYNDGSTVPVSVVTYSGYAYGVIAGQEANCSTNAPSGSNTDNAYWYFMHGSGALTATGGRPAWVSGISCRAGGCVRGDNASAYGQFNGVYVEHDTSIPLNQGKAQIAEKYLVAAGNLPDWMYNGSTTTTAAPFINTITNTVGTLQVGPSLQVLTPTVPITIGGPSGNTSNVIWFASHPTYAPTGFRMQFKTGGVTNSELSLNQNGSDVFIVTSPTTANQFGTGAAFPGAFSPYYLMVNGNSPSLTNARRMMMDTAAPTSGAHAQGEIVFNSAPAVGSPKGWQCTVAGTPGTWVSMGNL